MIDSTRLSSRDGIRAIAYYLPQYHPIPENDAWWGKGFTEWTNVAKARALFPGHYQPHIPADLGYYDLRVPETREAQAELARAAGIEGFCYYHYWFAGKRLLERPFDEVLRSRKPAFPFCLCWPNETWTGKWHGAPNRILIEQLYPGPQDDEQHFYAMLDAFGDDRYVKVEGKPLLVVFNPGQLPDPIRTTDLWRTLAVRAGLKGLYLVGARNAPWNPPEHGFDAQTTRSLGRVETIERRIIRGMKWRVERFMHWPRLFSYGRSLPLLLMPEATQTCYYPAVIPGWDNTPRSGRNGLVLHGSTPELFRIHLRASITQIRQKPAEHRILFLKSWNEWAEGNYVEPDSRYGQGYLQVLQDEICRA